MVYGLLSPARLIHRLTASKVVCPHLMRPMPLATEASRSTCTIPDHQHRVQRHRIILQSGPQGTPTEYYSLLADGGKARLQALIIPGNPGGAGYYVPFMQHFFEALDGAIDVFSVSQLGHDGLGENHSQVYDLKQQVRHKAAFLRERMLLPGRPPVLLVGHSIGAYMALHAAHQIESDVANPSAPAVAKILALMPFLTVDPESRKQRLLRAAAGAPWLLGAAAQLLGSFPAALQAWAVTRYASALDPHAVACTLGLLRWQTARNAFYLAQHEFRDLAAPADWWLLQEFGRRVSVVCTRLDMWFPHWKWEQMWLRVPDIQATMVTGQRHDFCVSEALSQKMAVYCADLVQHSATNGRAP